MLKREFSFFGVQVTMHIKSKERSTVFPGLNESRVRVCVQRARMFYELAHFLDKLAFQLC